MNNTKLLVLSTGMLYKIKLLNILPQHGIATVRKCENYNRHIVQLVKANFSKIYYITESPLRVKDIVEQGVTVPHILLTVPGVFITVAVNLKK